MTRRLTQTAQTLQKERRTEGPFHPYLFRRLGWAAVELAKHRRLID
jgi:hypothetical protein